MLVRSDSRRSLRLILLALVAALALLAGACGDDDGDTSADDDDTTTTEAAEDTDTTEDEDRDDEDDPDTTDDSDDSDDDEQDSDESDDDEGSSSDGQKSQHSEADEDATEVAWDTNAVPFRGRNGDLIAYTCPAGGTPGSIWGTEIYTDDTSVCTAAVHAGLITTQTGGRVVIEIAPGQEAYLGSEANDITSSDYGSWDGSFFFPDGED